MCLCCLHWLSASAPVHLAVHTALLCIFFFCNIPLSFFFNKCSQQSVSQNTDTRGPALLPTTRRHHRIVVWAPPRWKASITTSLWVLSTDTRGYRLHVPAVSVPRCFVGILHSRQLVFYRRKSFHCSTKEQSVSYLPHNLRKYKFRILAHASLLHHSHLAA